MATLEIQFLWPPEIKPIPIQCSNTGEYVTAVIQPSPCPEISSSLQRIAPALKVSFLFFGKIPTRRGRPASIIAGRFRNTLPIKSFLLDKGIEDKKCDIIAKMSQGNIGLALESWKKIQLLVNVEKKLEI